jgi:hypothetical protein
MTEAHKATPGPWERVDTPDYAEIHPKGERQWAIALVARAEDADLIAAAPDLLEALKALYAATPDNFGGPLGDACMKARAAIAKAEDQP